jgi:hypothetical protein
VLKLSPTIINLSNDSFYKECYCLIISNPQVSGFPIILGFFKPYPEANYISFTKAPPDGLNLSFPSFLSIFVPINSAWF